MGKWVWLTVSFWISQKMSQNVTVNFCCSHRVVSGLIKSINQSIKFLYLCYCMYTTSAYQWRSEGRAWPDGQSRMFVPLMRKGISVTKVFVRVTSMVKIVHEISKNLILILYRNRDFSFYLCEKKKRRKGIRVTKVYVYLCVFNFNSQDCLWNFQAGPKIGG